MPNFFSPPRRFALITLASIGLCAGIFLLIPHTFSHSSGYWDAYGQVVFHLNTEGTFGPERYLAPGFPLMLSFVSLVAPLSFFAERFVQIFFFLLLLRVVFLIGKEVFRDARVGYGAVFLMFLPAVTLQIFSLDALLFYTLLLTSGILFIWRGYARHSRMYMALAGLVFGYAALTDPIGLYVPVIVLVWFLFVSWKKIPLKKLALLAMLFSLSVLTLLVPWYVRNVATFENAHDAPIIQKEIEKDVFFNPRIRPLIFDFFLRSPQQALQIAAFMVFIPPDLATLDQNTSFRYRSALLAVLQTGALPAQFPASIFFAKIFIAGAHMFLVLLALVGAILFRSQAIFFLGTALLVYILFAVISVGSLTHFRGISPLQEFVYPLYPLLYLFATYTLVALHDRLKSRA